MTDVIGANIIKGTNFKSTGTEHVFIINMSVFLEITDSVFNLIDTPGRPGKLGIFLLLRQKLLMNAIKIFPSSEHNIY